MSEYAFKEPQSRNEAILQNALGADNVIGDPQSRIEELLQELDGELDRIKQEIEGLTNTTYEFDEGDTDGTIKVTPSDGEPEDVPVKGLKSGAFTSITASTVDLTPGTSALESGALYFVYE